MGMWMRYWKRRRNCKIFKILLCAIILTTFSLPAMAISCSKPDCSDVNIKEIFEKQDRECEKNRSHASFLWDIFCAGVIALSLISLFIATVLWIKKKISENKYNYCIAITLTLFALALGKLIWMPELLSTCFHRL